MPITCAVCSQQFERITNTHLARHNMTDAMYVMKYPNMPRTSVELASRKAAKMRGKPGHKWTDDERKKISVAKIKQFQTDPDYRLRVSRGTKEAMSKPEVYERFMSGIACRDQNGENNPFFGKHHTKETCRAISENKKRAEKISVRRSAWWNKNVGKTVEELYGEETGCRMRASKSERMSGEKNPAYGKVYDNVGRKVGKYKGNLFRSVWEYSFYKHLESLGFDLMTQIIYEPLKIPYMHHEHRRTYTPDFLIGPTLEMIEIKSCNEVKLMTKNSEHVNHVKWPAADTFCKEHGLVFKVMTEKDFHIISYAQAFRDSDIVWIRGGPSK